MVWNLDHIMLYINISTIPKCLKDAHSITGLNSNIPHYFYIFGGSFVAVVVFCFMEYCSVSVLHQGKNPTRIFGIIIQRKILEFPGCFSLITSLRFCY